MSGGDRAGLSTACREVQTAMPDVREAGGHHILRDASTSSPGCVMSNNVDIAKPSNMEHGNKQNYIIIKKNHCVLL